MQEKPCHFGNFFVICMKGRNMYSATSRDQISRKMMAKHAFSTAAAVIYILYYIVQGRAQVARAGNISPTDSCVCDHQKGILRIISTEQL